MQSSGLQPGPVPGGGGFNSQFPRPPICSTLPTPPYLWRSC